MITDKLGDDSDIKRQTRSVYCRSNMLIREFHFCSDHVKKLLYSSYCTNMYCAQLWWCYSESLLKKLRVAYNNGFRRLMNFGLESIVVQVVCLQVMMFHLLMR